MTTDASPDAAQAESLVAIRRLERVLEGRLDARGKAERELGAAREQADRLREEARAAGRAEAAARRSELIDEAERDAAELEARTEVDVAALRARAAAQREDAARRVVALVLPEESSACT